MNQRSFINIIVVIGIIILAGAVGYFIANQQMFSPTPAPVVCTQEAKQCPDGSYVGRTGQNCEFAKCPKIIPSPITKSECKKDADCPSPKYRCEAIEGIGTACPSTDPSCVPTSTITKGVCKLKEGNKCKVDSNCASGLLCHASVCTSPTSGYQCSGSNDTNCPTDYECVQGCGSPVPRPDEPPPSYFCQLKGYKKPYGCPICLAENTLIDTPSGAIPVQQLQKGMAIWTVNSLNARVLATILETVRTPVPPTHQVIRLVLDDGRELFVSPGHPTEDGRIIGDLSRGDILNGGRVVTVESILYQKDFTYDILPSGETGLYWANGILVGSTLFHSK